MAVLQHVLKVSAEERDQAEVKLSAVTRNTNKKGTAHIKSANKPEARRGKEGKFSNKSAAGAERGSVKVQEKSKPWLHMEIL